MTASNFPPKARIHAEMNPAGKSGGRLASEILELFAGGAFSFWHWVPENNVLTTHGNLTADTLEEWMMRIHPRDQSDFLRFIDREWKSGEAPSCIEYRFNANRQGDWIRVRHTASCTPRGEHSVLSCLIESLPLTSETESPLEKMEDEMKGAEVELLRFVESALDLRIQADPVPRLELLQRAIGADVMVLVHFGSKVVVTDSLPLSWDESAAPDAALHIPLIEALASMDPADQTHPFELELAGGEDEVTHFIVNPIHWGEGFKGALCAGYRSRENRLDDLGTKARLSLISAFSDGQLGRLQKVRAREEILERFQKAAFGNGSLHATSESSPEVSSVPAISSRRLALEEANLKGATILLVEDEVAVRKLVRKLLEMLGCSVIEAASGREALTLWPGIHDKVALVVSDIVMPEGVSGWDLAKELHVNHPDLGILLTSGYDELPEEHGLHGRPQIAFLQKPYEVRTLKNTLSRLIALAPCAA